MMIDYPRPGREIKLIWTKRTAQHIGKHGDLTIEQVVEAVNGKRVMFNIGRNMVKILCEYYGKILSVIASKRTPNDVLLITAYNADDKDKKIYRLRAQW